MTAIAPHSSTGEFELDSPVLSLKNICKQFDGIPVLKDVSFSLGKNEIHAIVGKNGAGKSTLMKILTGVYTADTGSISVFGTGIKTGQSSAVLQQGVSMVYQDLSLVPGMTVVQNIFLCSHPYKQCGFLQDKKAAHHAIDIFNSMGIDFIDPHTLVQNLSVGETQLVEIAKAMANKPEIIVFDEPTASLSDIETRQLFTIIRTLQQQGISIIYITHYLEDVMDLCDSVTVLRDGMAVASTAIADISVKDIVAYMIGDESAMHHVRGRSATTRDAEPLLAVHEASTRHIQPVTFCACAGEIIGLAGLLGSGRTEILRMLYGLDTLLSGYIQLQGKHIHLKHPGDAAKCGIALVPEERRTQGLVLDFSIKHNVTLLILDVLKKHGFLSSLAQRTITQNTIQNLEIKARDENQFVRFLSGGNQQKVVLGKCLASAPSVLLLDDPTFGVDVHAKTEIMKIIESYVAQGNVVLFISSEFSEIVNFCDRTYIVKKKRIVDEVDNHLLTEEKLLQQVQ